MKRIAILALLSSTALAVPMYRNGEVADIADAQVINIAATSTTAQVRSAVIDLRRELIDADQQLRALAAQVQKMLKESE